MKITNLIIQEKYKALLNRVEWKIRRLQIFTRDAFKCQYCCDSKRKLHAHHILYLKNATPWNYPENYLITLCEQCHEKEHIALDALELYDIVELLLSGMLAIDIWKKLKNNEKLKI